MTTPGRTTDQVSSAVRVSLNVTVPAAATLAREVVPELVLRPVQHRGVATPQDGAGFLSGETHAKTSRSAALATAHRG